MINTGEVASFIDNIIIETKEKEKHNKVVEEVVKRLAENDLYIKWKRKRWRWYLKSDFSNLSDNSSDLLKLLIQTRLSNTELCRLSYRLPHY